MKFLHTADWHLGKSLCDVPRLGEQAAFLNQIIAIFRAAANDEPYDALLVSGDIYDKAVASADAVELLSGFLARMNAEFPEAHILITSGNHDSASRLGFAARLLEQTNVHIASETSRLETPVVVKNAAIYQIPFLVPGSFPKDDDFSVPARTQEELFAKAVSIITESHAAHHAHLFPVVMAHATVFGSENAESAGEVGSLGSVSPALFAGFSYAALGHIHKMQKLDKSGRIRYSGSPLAYSFDDAGEKVFLSGTIDGRGNVEIEAIPVETAHPLVRLSGAFGEILSNPAYDAFKEHFVEIRCTDSAIAENPKLLLKEKFPHLLSFVRDRSISMEENDDFRERQRLLRRGAEISERELLESFLRDMHGDALDAEAAQKEAELFGSIFERVKNEEDAQ